MYCHTQIFDFAFVYIYINIIDSIRFIHRIAQHFIIAFSLMFNKFEYEKEKKGVHVKLNFYYVRSRNHTCIMSYVLKL